MGVEVLLEGCGWPGLVVRVGGFLPVESFDVDGDRGQDVLDVCLGLAVIAAMRLRQLTLPVRGLVRPELIVLALFVGGRLPC